MFGDLKKIILFVLFCVSQAHSVETPIDENWVKKGDFTLNDMGRDSNGILIPLVRQLHILPTHADSKIEKISVCGYRDGGFLLFAYFKETMPEIETELLLKRLMKERSCSFSKQISSTGTAANHGFLSVLVNHQLISAAVMDTILSEINSLEQPPKTNSSEVVFSSQANSFSQNVKRLFPLLQIRCLGDLQRLVFTNLFLENQTFLRMLTFGQQKKLSNTRQLTVKAYFERFTDSYFFKQFENEQRRLNRF
jgi:hypothetical protein